MDYNENSKASQVCLQKSSYSNIDIKSLLEPIGGIESYVKKNEKVLLKVNLLSASTPEKAVVTHPKLVEAVIEEVKKAGGIPYIGDSPSGQFSKRRLEKVYLKSGLIDLAKKLDIKLNYDTRSEKIKIENGKRIKKAPICKFILDADKIIALPKIKTHSFMMMTLASKIMYGAVPGLTKARYHSQFFSKTAFSDMLLDILQIAKPDLIIMDGIVGMQGDGPFSGDPVDLNILLASNDPIAMDLSICDILNINTIGIPVLKRANIRKLWPKKIEYPLLKPDDVKYEGFKLPSTAGYLLTGKKTPMKSPVPTDKCVACGECVDICPKNAIRIISKKANVDYSKCIKCYCCHEVCPEAAIKLEVIEK